MLYPCPGHTCRYQMICCLRFSQCEHVPFSFFFFSVEGLGSQCMSQTLSSTRTSWDPDEYDPLLELLCQALIGVFMEALLDEKRNIHVTKMRFIVLKVIPIGIIPDTQTRLSDGCSGLMLFLSQRVCQALHKTEVPLACGYELYFWCVLCSSGVPAIRWTQSLVAASRWTLDHTVHDDYVCNFLRDDLVISSGTKPDVNSVARGPDQQRSLDCFTHVMIDNSRIFPRSVLQADTTTVSYGLANLNVLRGRRSVVTKLGDCAVNQLQRPTTTSFSKVSRTTTLERATVVQYG